MEIIVNGKFVTEVLSVTEIILSMCVCVCTWNVTLRSWRLTSLGHVRINFSLAAILQ